MAFDHQQLAPAGSWSDQDADIIKILNFWTSKEQPPPSCQEALKQSWKVKRGDATEAAYAHAHVFKNVTHGCACFLKVYTQRHAPSLAFVIHLNSNITGPTCDDRHTFQCQICRLHSVSYPPLPIDAAATPWLLAWHPSTCCEQPVVHTVRLYDHRGHVLINDLNTKHPTGAGVDSG